MRRLVLLLCDWAERIAKWLTIVASCCIAIMMMVIFLDIVGTKFFSVSIPGALDISEELMVFMTLFPLAYLATKNSHVNITIMETRFSPKIRFFVDIIKYVIATAITGLISWRVFMQFQQTVAVMELKSGLDMPVWPANLGTVIAFGFLTIVWFLQLAKTLVLKSKNEL